MKKLREYYGEDRVANVLTLSTIQSRSAIQVACRGLGISSDDAQRISGLIESVRGQNRSLIQTYYGDEADGINPNTQFVAEMEKYPKLWEVASSIEGMITGYSIHAGGVIFVDEPFTESSALMKSPTGEIITQFDLHRAEAVGNIKFDLLSVNALDCIHTTLDLLAADGLIEQKPTLKETYESVIGIYNLERENIDMWKMLWRNEVVKIFQMSEQSGIQGIAKIKPESVDELATLNSVIRLMAPEKGAEIPLDTWDRHRKDISQWYIEMRRYGLSEEEVEWLASYPDITDGIAESQEALMRLVMEERLGGNDLNFADRCRKGLAKKDGPLFAQCEKDFFETATSKGCSKVLVDYVWNILLRVQRNYSFNKSHTLAYSLIGLQELNLAFRFPIVYWNCACLIADCGGNEEIEEIEIEEEIEVETPVTSLIEDFDDEDDEEEVTTTKTETKKKAKRSADYGKVAAAIGKMQAANIKVTPPDINKSSYTFTPDASTNAIRGGLKGIIKVGDEVVKQIIANRPYESVEDFLGKVKVNKPQMVNLIKCGAFDEFGDRAATMKSYLTAASEPKKRLTLQNVGTLINYELLPSHLDFERKVFNFNKYLKKLTTKDVIHLDDIAFEFYSNHFDMDLLDAAADGKFTIEKTKWKTKIYDKYMAKVKSFIVQNHDSLLEQLNEKLYKELADKYAKGSLSRWEMDSILRYDHPHELMNVPKDIYDIEDFTRLPEEPDIANQFVPRGGDGLITLYKISRIAGTVLDRNKTKRTVTLLTTEGVVTVKIFGNVFGYYDKRLSELGDDGKKHVVEESWFKRGNKIIVAGIRRGDQFIAKKYKNTPHKLVELIEDISPNGREIQTRGARVGDEE